MQSTNEQAVPSKTYKKRQKQVCRAATVLLVGSDLVGYVTVEV